MLVLGNFAFYSVSRVELLLTDFLIINRQQRVTKSPAPGHRGNASSPAPAASITSMVSTQYITMAGKAVEVSRVARLHSCNGWEKGRPVFSGHMIQV